MARTLDSILLAAQSNASRYPIAEIISQQREDDIPFDGTLLTSETFDEYGVNMVATSSGSLVMAYIYHSTLTSGIKFVYTDTARMTFTTVDLPLYTYSLSEIIGVSICEMTDGNIGMVLLVDNKSSHLYRLIRRIYTPAGVAVSDAEIANWSHDTFTSDPWVQTIDANSYLLVYGKISGSDYYIYKRTSSDFVTWSSESALSIGGLTSTWRLANPSIIKISTGDLWLWFDVLESIGPGGEELTNVYYSVSSNGGGTWGNAVKVTAYDGYGEIGGHPVAVQKAANQMNLIFTRKVGALHMQETASGWPTGDSTVELSWDSVNRKLYAINIWNSPGAKGIECVVKIDVDTWTVDQYWDDTTTPGFPSFICGGSAADEHAWFCNHVHDGHIICITCSSVKISQPTRWLWVLDGEANTITNYYFDTYAPYSLTQNVTHSLDSFYTELHASQVDAANNRVYLLFVDTYIWHPKISVGYLDLTESSPEVHIIIDEYATSVDFAVGLGYSQQGGMWIDLEGGYIVLTASSNGTSWVGGLKVFDLASGALIVEWEGGTDGDFPYHGITKPFVYNGVVYAGMLTYTSGYGQSSFRGLAEINISTETVTLYRPTYCSEDDHFFGRPYHLQDGRIAMTHLSYGVAVFDTISKTWELFSNDNVIGLTVDGLDGWSESQIAFDETNEMIFVGDPRTAGTENRGVIMFSINGYIRQASQQIGTDPGGGWSFAAAEQLVQGFLDYDAAAAVEPGSSSSMYVFWTNETPDGEQSIKWDKDGSDADLSSYLLRGTEIVIERGIDGKPATLNFSVSNGHLFDPYNQASLLNMALRKGRKLTVRFGDKIGGTEYWENQGSYYVTGVSMSFRRGEYPVMAVEAEDLRALWQYSHIVATDVYNNTGEDILSDLMQDVANMDVADINFPAMGGPAFPMQWIDTTLDEIVTQICNRLGYFFRLDMDGKANARPITNVGSIDNTYTGNADLFAYSPDDKYSDFTNRVTVMGQELDFTTVTFNEERITRLAGTLGWWGCDAEHIIWFSDDKSRRCVNPRFVAIETPTTMLFELEGDVTESLTECGTADDNKFCTMNVYAPDLTPQLAAAIGMIITGMNIGDWAPTTGGPIIKVGSLITKVGIIWALMILGSTANYQYEIWAQPLGSVRRSVQGTWNDEEHQSEIGAVIPAVITDPLCYSAADCIAVATFEGTVVQMQRKRVTITKTAHLQDEEGDTIRRVHPYSGQNIDLFIAKLKRTMLLPEEPDGNGHFMDEIEGWVVS